MHSACMILSGDLRIRDVFCDLYKQLAGDLRASRGQTWGAHSGRPHLLHLAAFHGVHRSTGWPGVWGIPRIKVGYKWPDRKFCEHSAEELDAGVPGAALLISEVTCGILSDSKTLGW